ncbi:predicted protein [Chaetomium globosum CBS 148.51]|uniref:Uncharacterized protein n=1 Tax=Chaetomium globosum (strain ATCC 6205 / CBS 148.51 / DSM 1962 / NBRC 6347 / NRRL 1970) TaxID=306901 RepID=Q2HE02_CHAGB|nr:uncharacterized protein CHGG_01552 [Chaetomium globosum CBS 148.51]EAQ93317.1 predicted protein [Chaetomium globosum CBS 148.51]
MSSGDRYGRSSDHENAEERALRRMRDLKDARKRQYEKLNDWVREQEAAMARLRPARDRAEASHETVMSMVKKLKNKEAELQLMADSTTETKFRRSKNRPATDGRGNMTPEARRQYEEDRERRRRLTQREYDNLLEMYRRYKSEDQEAQEAYEQLKDKLKHNEGHIKKVKQHIQELEAEIDELEEYLHGQERRRRQQDQNPKFPPPDGSGGGSSGGYGGGSRGRDAPFGYGGGGYVARYDAGSRGGSGHGSQAYGGSGGYHRAAGQTHATPDGKTKQDVAGRLAALDLGGEKHRRESKPTASKTSKTKSAAGTTAGGSRSSRR